MACVGCGEALTTAARFCSVCGRAVNYAAVPPPPAPARSLPSPTFDGLFRPREGRMVAGVCAGFARRFGWDPTIVRLILVLLAPFGVGTPVIAYLVAWVVMPNGHWSLPARAGSGAPGSMRV